MVWEKYATRHVTAQVLVIGVDGGGGLGWMVVIGMYGIIRVDGGDMVVIGVDDSD